jgi:hypothetical protein
MDFIIPKTTWVILQGIQKILSKNIPAVYTTQKETPIRHKDA